MNVAEFTSHYTPEFVARLMQLALTGDGVAPRVDKVLRRLARTGPEGKYLRDQVRQARGAASEGNSNESIGRVVELAEWLLASGFPELTALLCGLALNMCDELGDDLDPGDAADLANITGALAFHFQDLDTARAQYSKALELARVAGSRSAEASFLLNLTNVARVAGDFPLAQRLALEALAIADDLQDEYRQLQLLFTVGEMATDVGDLDAAQLWLSRAAVLTKRVRHPGLTASYHHLNGLIATELGDYKIAEAAWKRSLAAARRAGDHDKEVAALQNLAAVAGDAGDYSLALRRTRKATEAAAGYRLLPRVTALLPALVRAEANHGNKPRALDAARQLVEISVLTNAGVGEAEALLGATLVDSGHLDEGITKLESAWQILRGEQSSEADAARPHVVHNLVVAHANARTLATVWSELSRRIQELEPLAATDEMQMLGLLMLTQPDIDQSHAGEVLLASVKRRPAAERAWAAATLAAQATHEGADHAAIQLLDHSLATAARRNQETTLRHIRNDLALALTRTRRYTRARKLLNINSVKAAADEDFRTQWLSMFNLAELSRRTNQYGDAELHARRALDVASAANDTEGILASRLQLGMILSDVRRQDEAIIELSLVLRTADSDTSEYAGAAHSLANIALANDELEKALEYYRTAAEHEARGSIQALESLLGYAEALAAAGQRRRFNRVFQRAIDGLDHVPYTEDLAIRFARIAGRWARGNKTKFAGEVFAAALLLPASVGQERFREAETGGGYPALDDALLAVATELHYQQEVEGMENRQELLDATQAELSRIANAPVAEAAISTVRQLLAGIESEEE